MGQYFIVVNKTKKEMLIPDKFNDGAKLREFGNSQEGTMLGLAALLGQHADADFSVPYDAEKHATQWIKDKSGREIIVPAKESMDADPKGIVCGRWCGDKIAFPGEYGTDGTGLTKAERRKLGDPLSPEYRGNLYEYALRYYVDISNTVLELLAKCGHGAWASTPQEWVERLDEFLGQILRNQYPMPEDMYHNLDWMTLEYLDRLVSRIKTTDQWKLLRAFLKDRKLPPPLVEALDMYKFDSDGEFDRWHTPRNDIILKMERWSREHRHPAQLLPDAHHLAAALYVQGHVDGAPMGPKKEPAAARAVAIQAGADMRSRRIDLQTKHSKPR